MVQTELMFDAGVTFNTGRARSWRVALKLGANTHREGNGPEGLSGVFFDPVGAVEYPIPRTIRGSP